MTMVDAWVLTAARGLPLNPYDRATFCTGGTRDYTDYPFSTPIMEGNP